MEQQITELIANYPEWSVSGETLVGNWRVADFDTVQALVLAIMKLADELNHHPTVTFGYNTVQVETTTHDAGNQITSKDTQLAARVSQVVGE